MEDGWASYQGVWCAIGEVSLRPSCLHSFFHSPLQQALFTIFSVAVLSFISIIVDSSLERYPLIFSCAFQKRTLCYCVVQWLCTYHLGTNLSPQWNVSPVKLATAFHHLLKAHHCSHLSLNYHFVLLCFALFCFVSSSLAHLLTAKGTIGARKTSTTPYRKKMYAPIPIRPAYCNTLLS